MASGCPACGAGRDLLDDPEGIKDLLDAGLTAAGAPPGLNVMNMVVGQVLFYRDLWRGGYGERRGHGEVTRCTRCEAYPTHCPECRDTFTFKKRPINWSDQVCPSCDETFTVVFRGT